MKRTVLIVDDVIVNRRILRRILDKDYEVLDTGSGRKALELLRRKGEHVSAVLLDIVMPGMDGYEVLRQMRSDPAMAAIPVIVASANTDDDSEAKALSLGANDYISMPYKAAAIRHRLGNAISLRETAAAAISAQRDDLTGLYNRKAFFEKAAELISQHESGHYVIACFDVDNFKVINDQYGSDKGDQVLKTIASVFSAGFSPVGGVCCRIMADNFAVLYPRSFMDSPELTEIRAAASTPDSSMQPITFSIGRYIVDDLTLPVSGMYDRATLAENTVKGRVDANIAIYDESMRAHLLQEQEIISEMRPALRERQFEVWFQPQINHSTGALVGAEALVRWKHPERGLLSPGLFVPVFERNGFIYELDKYIWEESCALLRKWLDQGRRPLPVSVNISRYDLLREDLCSVLAGLLETYRLPAELLRLEITESAFAKSAEQIISVVKRLIALGFTIEIDDFGSGYSSLNTLKDVPAHVLKLDMRFLEGKDNLQRSGSVLDSVVRMARWLGMSVIAEGVETVIQADYLESIGCSYVQGFLYAKPMPAGEYEKYAGNSAKERKMLALETVETLDNSAFWDPSSMDTLIFNSFVGGACIFEYHNGRADPLRANRKFAQALGGGDLTLEEALRISWHDHLAPESRPSLLDSLQQCIDTGDEVACEATFINLTEKRARACFRLTLRVIARAGSHYLFYCVNEDITAEKQAVTKLRETDEQLRFLNDTAHDLLAQPDNDKGIDCVLRKVLDYFDGNRAYVMELRDDTGASSNTYEVCAPGVSSEMDMLQDVPYEAASFWWEAFYSDRYINIEDVSALDESRAEERRLLEAQGIRSLIAVPLRRDGRPIGFLGVDDPRRQQAHVGHLRAIGDYIAVILTRRDLSARIEKDGKTLLALMNDTPGGFMRMQVLPDGRIVPVYVNDGFCRLVGMTSDEVFRLYQQGALAGVHPEDRDMAAGAVETMLKTGEPRGVKCRLLCGGGGYVRLTVIGRVTKNDSGESFFNMYYTDVPEPADGAGSYNEQVLRLAAEHSDRIIYRYDLATRTARADSDSAASVHAVETDTDLPESIIGRGDIFPESVEDYRRIFREIHEGLRSGGARIHLRDTAGTPRWADMKYSVIFDGEHRPKTAVVSFLDISKDHEKELAYDRYLQTIGENSQGESVMAYLESDLTTDLTEKLGGAMLPDGLPDSDSRSVLVEHTASRYIVPQERELFRSFFSREHLITAFSDGARNLSQDWSILLEDGSAGYIRSELQMVQDPYSGHIKSYTLLRDVTDETRYAISVKLQAETDGMTGLLNKTTAEAGIRLRLSRADGAPCALLIADLDNLKSINDSLGHAQGDEAILTLSGLLRSQLRQSDIVGRVGGDEFAAFLDGGTEVRLRGIMTAFMRRMSAIRIGEGRDVPLRVSVGIAVGVIGSCTYEELFQQADRALYHVKRNGKDDFAFYTPDMEQNEYEYKGHSAVSIWQTSYFDSDEMEQLLKAVSVIYPLVVAVNLTQNSYYMLQYENYATRRAMNAGVFDDLVADGAATFHPDDRASFSSAFSRESLLSAFERGKAMVSHTGRQLGDDGIYRLIRTDVVFVRSRSGDDVLEVTLARELSPGGDNAK